MATNDTKQPASLPRRIEFRSAKDLFSRLSVPEIEEVLKKTRFQANARQKELRDLVGARYTELLKSAEAIVDMSHRSDDLVTNVLQLRRAISGVRDATPEAGPTGPRVCTRQLLAQATLLHAPVLLETLVRDRGPLAGLSLVEFSLAASLQAGTPPPTRSAAEDLAPLLDRACVHILRAPASGLGPRSEAATACAVLRMRTGDGAAAAPGPACRAVAASALDAVSDWTHRVLAAAAAPTTALAPEEEGAEAAAETAAAVRAGAICDALRAVVGVAVHVAATFCQGPPAPAAGPGAADRGAGGGTDAGASEEAGLAGVLAEMAEAAGQVPPGPADSARRAQPRVEPLAAQLLRGRAPPDDPSAFLRGDPVWGLALRTGAAAGTGGGDGGGVSPSAQPHTTDDSVSSAAAAIAMALSAGLDGDGADGSGARAEVARVVSAWAATLARDVRASVERAVACVATSAGLSRVRRAAQACVEDLRPAWLWLVGVLETELGGQLAPSKAMWEESAVAPTTARASDLVASAFSSAAGCAADLCFVALEAGADAAGTGAPATARAAAGRAANAATSPGPARRRRGGAEAAAAREAWFASLARLPQGERLRVASSDAAAAVCIVLARAGRDAHVLLGGPTQSRLATAAAEGQAAVLAAVATALNEAVAAAEASIDTAQSSSSSQGVDAAATDAAATDAAAAAVEAAAGRCVTVVRLATAIAAELPPALAAATSLSVPADGGIAALHGVAARACAAAARAVATQAARETAARMRRGGRTWRAVSALTTRVTPGWVALPAGGDGEDADTDADTDAVTDAGSLVTRAGPGEVLAPSLPTAAVVAGLDTAAACVRRLCGCPLAGLGPAEWAADGAADGVRAAARAAVGAAVGAVIVDAVAPVGAAGAESARAVCEEARVQSALDALVLWAACGADGGALEAARRGVDPVSWTLVSAGVAAAAAAWASGARPVLVGLWGSGAAATSGPRAQGSGPRVRRWVQDVEACGAGWAGPPRRVGDLVRWRGAEAARCLGAAPSRVGRSTLAGLEETDVYARPEPGPAVPLLAVRRSRRTDGRRQRSGAGVEKARARDGGRAGAAGGTSAESSGLRFVDTVTSGSWLSALSWNAEQR